MKTPIPTEAALRRFGEYTETTTASDAAVNTDEPIPPVVTSTSRGWTPLATATKTTTGSVRRRKPFAVFELKPVSIMPRTISTLVSEVASSESRLLRYAFRGDRRRTGENHRHRKHRLNADNQSERRNAERGRPCNCGPFPAHPFPEQDAASDDRRYEYHGHHSITKHGPASYQSDRREPEKQVELHLRAPPGSRTFVLFSARRQLRRQGSRMRSSRARPRSRPLAGLMSVSVGKYIAASILFVVNS